MKDFKELDKRCVHEVETSILNEWKKQNILERSGYEIKRITFREWQYSKQATLNRILT